MSGIPSKEGVTELLKILRSIEQMEAEMEELRPKAVRLRTLETEKANAASTVAKMLSAMDVAATGNYGFESRMAWFVAEVARQSKVTP